MIGPNYKVRSTFMNIILKKQGFLFEVFVLLIEPKFIRMLCGGEKIIPIDTINWNDNGGIKQPH